MTKEKNLQDLMIVRLLIGLGHPKDSSDVQEWLKKVKTLQLRLLNFWKSDPSGKLMIQSLRFLYEVIARDVTSRPDIWSVLDLVDEDKISDFVDGILSHPQLNDDAKVKNVLTAMVEELGQCGPFTSRLQHWIFAIVHGLESRKKFEVLTEVSEKVIWKLMQLLMLPLYRPLIYPIFKQFLYPVVIPSVFYKIIYEVPRALNKLHQKLDSDVNESVAIDFAGLIQSLLFRFPAKPELEDTYNLIRDALLEFRETTFDPESMIFWHPEETPDSCNFISKTPYKGLMNQGNTCFMNSVLQILYMTTRFRIELVHKELDSCEKAASDLQQLFAFMQESNRKVLVPNGVMNSTLPPTFRWGYQQDSSEYLIYLLDVLHENEVKAIRKNQELIGSRHKKQEGNGDYEENEKERERIEEETLISKFFEGTIVSTTTCSFCEQSFPKTEHFRNLHLPVLDDCKTYDLQNLIELSLEPEDLCNENVYDCDHCKTKRDATRRHAIAKAPEHLILTLKLFRFDSMKKQRLKLHSRLNEVNAVELPVYNQSQRYIVRYDLKGAILHSGSSLDGGHYFSSAVDESGQWYIFNDSIVSLSNNDSKWGGSGTPYVLILRQSNVCDPPIMPLPSSLQLLVNKDNQKFLTEQRFQQRTYHRRKDYDDDTPPNSDSFGGSGPPLVI